MTESNTSAAPEAPEYRKRGRSKTPLIITIAVLAVAAIVAALVFWLSTVTHRSAESQTVAAAMPDWLKPWARLLPQQGTTAAARKE